MPPKHFWRDASGRFTFELDHVPANCYMSVCDELAKAFDLVPHTPAVSNGWDIVFQDYRRGDAVVGLEWDNWTGFTVVAQSPLAEELVRQIAVYLLASRWAHSPPTAQ